MKMKTWLEIYLEISILSREIGRNRKYLSFLSKHYPWDEIDCFKLFYIFFWKVYTIYDLCFFSSFYCTSLWCVKWNSMRSSSLFRVASEKPYHRCSDSNRIIFTKNCCNAQHFDELPFRFLFKNSCLTFPRKPNFLSKNFSKHTF